MRLRADGRLRRGVPGARAGVGGRGPRARPRAGGGAAGIPLRQAGVRHRVLAVRDSRAAGPLDRPLHRHPPGVPGPIYSQKRVGRIGRSGEARTFDMYKFRSMHKDADERLAELAELNEADGPLFKIKDDPRVTRIGKFIRKHSIDELPQFLNCLAGQISCVGPRPPLPSEVAQYDERAMRRLSVKPGLTGYWQVSGRSDTTFDDMVAMDLWSTSSRKPNLSFGTPL